MQTNFNAEFIAETQSRGETYALLARLLRQEISPALLHGLRTMRESFHGSDGSGQGQILLDRYLSGTKALDESQVATELAADYAALFLNAGNHPAYPYESVYTSPEQLLMQEGRDQVRQMYAAAGLKRSCRLNEPEDHIALEMEFMSHLCFRTAAALEQSDARAAHTCLQSQREFLENHLFRWVPRFCQDVVHNAKTDFYRALGYMVRDFLELEKELVAK